MAVSPTAITLPPPTIACVPIPQRAHPSPPAPSCHLLPSCHGLLPPIVPAQLQLLLLRCDTAASDTHPAAFSAQGDADNFYPDQLLPVSETAHGKLIRPRPPHRSTAKKGTVLAKKGSDAQAKRQCFYRPQCVHLQQPGLTCRVVGHRRPEMKQQAVGGGAVRNAVICVLRFVCCPTSQANFAAACEGAGVGLDLRMQVATCHRRRRRFRHRSPPLLLLVVVVAVAAV